MPNPSDENAALVEDLHRQGHEHLGNDIRRGENRCEYKVDDHPIHSEFGEFLVIEHPYFHEKEDDNREFEGDTLSLIHI